MPILQFSCKRVRPQATTTLHLAMCLTETPLASTCTTHYVLSCWLPHGTHMTWGVNLSTTNTVNKASAIACAFRSFAVHMLGVVLDFIEIGNDTDLYKNNELRLSDWTAQE